MTKTHKNDSSIISNTAVVGGNNSSSSKKTEKKKGLRFGGRCAFVRAAPHGTMTCVRVSYGLDFTKRLVFFDHFYIFFFTSVLMFSISVFRGIRSIDYICA